MNTLTRTEEEILLAIYALKDDAYLVSIRDRINLVMGKSLTIGAIHIPLLRLEEARLVESVFGESTPVRGGRRKRIFSVTAKGIESLKTIKKRQNVLWASFERDFSG